MLKRDPSLNSDNLLVTLYVVAYLVPVDIAHIESFHASIRRLLHIMSLQTHTISMKLLCALAMCMKRRAGKSKGPGARDKGNSARTKASSQRGPRLRRRKSRTQAP